MRTMQHLDGHGSPSFAWIVLAGHGGSRSTALKHLPPMITDSVMNRIGDCQLAIDV
jgi:hypothetical protein